MHDEKNVLESAIGERDRIAPENSVVLNPWKLYAHSTGYHLVNYFR
jgi:hypothetical protein